VDLHSDSSCLIRSFTTISARSGITSHAMLRMTVSDISCTTRRAMRSTSSSDNLLPSGIARTAAATSISVAGSGSGSGGGGGGGALAGSLDILSRSSKLIFGNALVSPLYCGGSSHIDGADGGGSGVDIAHDGVSGSGSGIGAGGGGGGGAALSRSSNVIFGNA